jgi:D-glycero-D-manno-heptose 1,7-bisphosphate phosphatase
MVTNQYTIGEGIISEEAYGMFTAALLRRLQFVGVTFTAVLYCPHSRIVDCECRKPKPGLIQRFFTDNPDVDRERSVLIGDSSVDILAGSAAGIETIGVGSAALQGLGTYRCDTLIEAAKWLSVREYGS